jgi:hypothetical protein
MDGWTEQEGQMGSILPSCCDRSKRLKMAPRSFATRTLRADSLEKDMMLVEAGNPPPRIVVCTVDTSNMCRYCPEGSDDIREGSIAECKKGDISKPPLLAFACRTLNGGGSALNHASPQDYHHGRTRIRERGLGRKLCISAE